MNELSRKSPNAYKEIQQRIQDDSSIFVYKNKQNDLALKIASKPIIDEYNLIIGPGEAECAGYASALDIPIVISDNVREFMYLEDDYIMLNHSDVLCLLCYFNHISLKDASDIYNNIQSKMTQPSSHSFQDKRRRSMQRFKTNGWSGELGLD